MLQEETKTYFQNLDGLRFFAFFAVFVNHSMACLGYYNKVPLFISFRKQFLMNGDLGVNFFFVLSGFLITYLLLQEKQTHQKINIKNFYIRRVLRIWPLYFFIIALCLFVFPMFELKLPKHFPIDVDLRGINPWLYVTFIGNVDYLLHGINNVLIGVLWSVSVEEQFYLFWPLVIAFVPTKHLLKTFIAIIIGSTLFRMFFSNGGNAMILKYHSFSVISDLTVGAAIALLATKEKVIERIKHIPKILIIAIYVVAFTLFPFREYIWKFGKNYVYIAAIMPVVFSSFFAFVIMEQNYALHSFYKASKLKVISAFGKYTYGMYCYHMICFFLVTYCFYLLGINVINPNKYIFVSIVIVAIAVTIVISKISYIYFESKFLALKTKFNTK